MVHKSRRLLANTELEVVEAKRQALLRSMLQLRRKGGMWLQSWQKKKHLVWLQTVFPAQHAARTNAAIKSLDPVAMSPQQFIMSQMQSLCVFKRWLTIPDPWEPDLSLLHNFGTLPDFGNKFGAAARRPVRCGPQLAAFIQHHTEYRAIVTGPEPEPAIRFLLKACFAVSDKLFQGPCSPYSFLRSGKRVIDLRFMQGVVAASKWLGPHVLPKANFIWFPLIAIIVLCKILPANSSIEN